MRTPARILLVGLALAAAACGKKANTRCTGVTCSRGLTCDPGDGQCKCGGEGGIFCAADALCDSATNTCTTPQSDGGGCANVTCSHNTACDPADGVCKCGGSGGVVCGATEICDPQLRTCSGGNLCASVLCSGGTRCDPSDGVCKCGGQVCGLGQACGSDGGACVDTPCSGVHCVGDTACDPTDGACKCNGSLCGAGQACVCANDAGSCAPDARSCRDSTRCVGVTCTGGSSCDPLDGLCHCGHAEDGGVGGPICGANQACDVSIGGCLGGDRCQNVSCSIAGTSCDPEDGRCKCGGQGGDVCGADQVCFETPTAHACRTPCDILNPLCPTGLACYFDETASAQTGFCATPGTKDDTGNPAPFCNSANDCIESYDCAPENSGAFPGLCHRYCYVPGGSGGCTGSKNCLPIPGAPPDSGWGDCQ